jgi:phosphatidylglycerophosphatase A
VYCATVMEKTYGHDASQIVIDEFMGMQISLFMMKPSISLAIAGFLLFRLFDIVKPFPVGRSQKIKGGLGVVVDDLLAGLYAYAALYIITRFIDLPM